MKIEKRFVQVGEIYIHCRIAGSGPALVLLHASPTSSAMFEPFIELLAPYFTVVAPDTPGYGLSDNLSAPPEDIQTYTSVLHQFFSELGLKRFAIYGSATGAQLAVRYGLTYPEQVTHLFLDNTAHFSDKQRNSILSKYFPDLTPTADGSHLKQLWKITRGIFTHFPWFSDRPEDKLEQALPPPVVLQMVANDFLQSVAHYDWAYHAAFVHEKAEYVQALEVASTLFYWEASIIRPYIDQLLSFSFPDNISVVNIPKDRTERLQEMKKRIKIELVNEDSVSLLLKEDQNKKRPFYISTIQEDDVYGFMDSSQTEEVVLLLHPFGSSGEVVHHQFANEYPGRSFVFFDLPGHGFSTGIDNLNFTVMEEIVNVLKKKGLNLTSIYSPSQDSTLVNQLGKTFNFEVLEGAPIKTLSAPIVPDSDGKHLLVAWQDFSENDSAAPEFIHKQLMAWIRCKVPVDSYNA